MQPLEDDLGHELDVAGFTGADGWSAVEVTDGVRYLAEAAGGSANPRFCYGVRGASAAHGPNPGGKVDAIQEVEEICSKLDSDPLGDWDVLDE